MQADTEKADKMSEAAAALEARRRSETVRVDVAFTSFGLKLGALPELRVPVGWANLRGWVDTTYLDTDLRLGRGDKGSLFVTARQKENAEA